jgi:hypothetical protein
MMIKKTKRLTITYSVTLLILYVASIFVIVSFRDHDVPLDEAIFTSLLSIFGSWATRVSKLTAINHAGELCSPSLIFMAIGLSVGLIAVIRISLSSSKKWITALCVTLYFPLVLVWMYLGMGLMASYLTSLLSQRLSDRFVQLI